MFNVGIAVVFLLMLGPGLWYSILALRNLSESGLEHRWRIYLFAKTLAPPEYFTPLGQRYRRNALIYMFAAVLLFVSLAIGRIGLGGK